MNQIRQYLANSIVYKLLPSPLMRMKLRRSPLVRAVIRLLWGGTKAVNYPNSHYRIFMDGYRNIGYYARNLEACEKEEKQLIRWLLSSTPVACAWDIGANIGTWSMFLTVQQPDVRICCFEPDPENIKYLAMTKSENKIDTWEIFSMALSNADGSMIFHFDSTTGTSGSLGNTGRQQWTEKYFHARTRSGVVAVSSIDSVLVQNAPIPQFIKCDVEGHEYNVFLGGQKLLAQHRPVIFWEDSGDPRTSAFLSSLGYCFYDVRGMQIRTPQWNTLAIHASMTDLENSIARFATQAR